MRHNNANKSCSLIGSSPHRVNVVLSSRQDTHEMTDPANDGATAVEGKACNPMPTSSWQGTIRSGGARTGNLFTGLAHSPGAPEEFLQLAGSANGPHVERIVSHGTGSAWFEQGTVEYVALLRGSATLILAAADVAQEEVALEPGDFVTIPRGLRHRVSHTDADGPTVWLAFHF